MNLGSTKTTLIPTRAFTRSGLLLFTFHISYIIFFFLGCAGPRTQLMTQVRTELSASQTEKAYTTYKTKVGKTERVDELLNLGLLAFEAGDYNSAHIALADAERLAEERETKSLSREAAGIAISDRVRAYQGTVFDKAMLHYYRALAFVAQGDPSSAVVEGRRIASYLEVNARESKHTYKDDAFLQWVNGSLYQSFKQDNDAWISYKRAREIYKDYYGISEPSFLCPVTLEAARYVGVPEEEKALKESCPDAADKLKADYGRVVVLCETGIAPPILEDNIVLPIFGNDPQKFDDDEARYHYAEEVSHRHGDNYAYDQSTLKYLLRVAMPYYAQDYAGSSVRGVEIRGDSTEPVICKAELAQDNGAILRKDLADRYPAILVRAITRALIKYGAKEAAEKIGNENSSDLGKIMGFIVNAAGVATEAADTRSWETLPDRIFAADFQLAPGTHRLRAVFQDDIGGVLYRQDFPEVIVKKGEIVFLRARCVK